MPAGQAQDEVPNNGSASVLLSSSSAPSFSGCGTHLSDHSDMEGAPQYPPDIGGSRIWDCRAEGGMPCRHLPANKCPICSNANGKGCAHLEFLCYMAKREASIRHQLQRAEQKLPQAFSAHEEPLILRILPLSWRSASLVRLASGYRHFALHSRMWDWFIFRYNGLYYRCIALPFGWTASPFCFVKLFSLLTR